MTAESDTQAALGDLSYNGLAELLTTIAMRDDERKLLSSGISNLCAAYALRGRFLDAAQARIAQLEQLEHLVASHQRYVDALDATRTTVPMAWEAIDNELVAQQEQEVEAQDE